MWVRLTDHAYFEILDPLENPLVNSKFRITRTVLRAERLLWCNAIQGTVPISHTCSLGRVLTSETFCYVVLFSFVSSNSS